MSPSRKANNARRGPRPANIRLRRLLVMLPWLMERGEANLADMAKRFRLSERELVADLELASVCGLPPFVDEMIDVFVDDGMVYAGVPRLFTRPMRLTAPEGFALVAACRAALELPGADPQGPLSRALAKLEAALGDAELQVELAAPDGSDELAAAAGRGEVVALRYWAAGTDTVSERRVAPRAVFSDRGNWYLLADDLARGVGGDAERTFRIDRIESVSPTGETVAARDVELPGEWFTGQDDSITVVRLRVQPRGTWIVERYPVRAVSAGPEGTTDVELAVVSERWLAKLLLRLGPDATVLDPVEWRDLGSRTAATVLARYP